MTHDGGDSDGVQDPAEPSEIPWYQTKMAVVASGVVTVLVIIAIVFAVVLTANYSTHSNRRSAGVPAPMTTTTTTTTTSSATPTTTTTTTSTSDTTSSEMPTTGTAKASTTTAAANEAPPATAESPNRSYWKQFSLFGTVFIGLLLAGLMDHRRHTKQRERDSSS